MLTIYAEVLESQHVWLTLYCRQIELLLAYYRVVKPCLSSAKSPLEIDIAIWRKQAYHLQGK